ncbi:hypothetical protein [Haloglomus halophilum]|uniref:hypothetical protein n=1 Tax=Haloglomus halophilum TaxID=2962672 RepID=UPI0020C98810|nr:hypothetical protein [Haloglomus halophilum]
MSTNSPSLWPPADASPARIADQLRRGARTAVDHVRPLLQATAFWSAVVMPFLYVPLLLGGLTGGEFTTFVGLLLVNALVLVLGHNHHVGDPTEESEAATQ